MTVLLISVYCVCCRRGVGKRVSDLSPANLIKQFTFCKHNPKLLEVKVSEYL